MENKHLKYLQDLPRFDENWGGKVPDDKFKHQGYVDALHNLVKECPTPFCLGLFGGWGSGKTGIVLELCNTLKQKNKDIKHLYFDVWKYSADSLRRQLLIKIDEEWFDKKLDFENKLYIDTKKTTEYKTTFNEKSFIHKLWWLIPICLVMLAIGYLQTPIGLECKDWATIVGLTILPIIIAVITSVESKGDIQTVVEDSTKPVSPEQFELLFKQNILKNSLIKNKKIVIILDNLDRCSSDRVIEVLTGISTFLGEKNCVYIIPCDVDRIKEHIRHEFKIENSNNSEYEEEFIRKLFNVQIYLRPVIEDYLLDYFNVLLDSIGLEDSERDKFITVLVTGLSQNPRKAKQLLNNFVANYNLAVDIENQDSQQSALPSNVISTNKAFLLKTTLIQNYFSTEFKILVNAFGMYRELMDKIQLTERGENVNLSEMILALIKNTDFFNFMKATKPVDDLKADVFFRFSHISDLENITELLNLGISRNTKEFIRLFDERSDSFEVIISEAKKIIATGAQTDDLKVNIIHTLFEVAQNKEDETINKQLCRLINGIHNDNLIKSFAKDMNPYFWKLFDKDYFNPTTSKPILIHLAKSLYGDIKDNKFSLKTAWLNLEVHIKNSNNAWRKLDEDVKLEYRNLIRIFIESDFNSKDKYETELFWEWVLPKNNEQIPEIFRDRALLQNILNQLPPDYRKQTRNAGLIITRLNDISGEILIDSLFTKLLELIIKPLKLPEVVEELHPANLLLDFVVESKSTFSNKIGEEIFVVLESQKDGWVEDGYDFNKWIKGLAELYKILSKEKDFYPKVRNMMVPIVKENTSLYYEEYERSKFYKFKYLNYFLFDAIASLDSADVAGLRKEEWKLGLKKIITDIYEYDAKEIFDNMLKNWLSSTHLYAHHLSNYTAEILEENVILLVNSRELIVNILEEILNKKFWANIDENTVSGFIKPYLTIILHIHQNEKDNILEKYLKDLYAKNDINIKKILNDLRNNLFESLSRGPQERVLSQIWTAQRNSLATIGIENLDLQFLMHYFYILKNHEKLEIFDELFDQLNSNTPIGINLFEAFALNDEIISYNQDEWVSRIKPLLVQNLVNQNYSNLVENIKRKIDFFSEYNKQTLNDILNPYS